MKPIEQAFLSNILESPDDDAPRLIYADWLEEDGQAERAEFIRVQCELAGFVAPKTGIVCCEGKGAPTEAGNRKRCRCRPCILRRREWHLAKGNDKLHASIGTTSKWIFRRGFGEEVTISLAEWLEHGPALVRVAPLRVVRLSDYQPMFNASWGWAYVPGRSELGAGNWWRGFRDVLLKTFSTLADALAAMSRCCLLYACVQTVPVG